VHRTQDPKLNAHIERFNRTVHESFVDYHEDLLFTDLDAFNQQLAKWLVFHNAECPRHALGQRLVSLPRPKPPRVPEVVDSYTDAHP
jgi:transposase InsO family protein